MSRITSSVGLITGIPIEETVKQLMAIAARPKDLLTARNKALEQEQLALDTLGSRLLGFQFAVNKLKASGVFTTREVSSSNADVLTAALPATGTAPVGSYQVRPVRAASAQQLVTQPFQSLDDLPTSGTFTFGFGGFLDQGIFLSDLNGGAGVPRGKIRITDRSGSSAVIDLTVARTVDDVLTAINANADIAVTAATDGDSFTLTDTSGGGGSLVVQEVGGGTTAAGLGLSGISVVGNEATGADVFRLHAGTKLSTLNDGNGVQITAEGVVDLDVELSDGTLLAIDLADAATLGDVLEQITAVDPAKLSAAISGDGNRIVLNDLTAGAGDFTVANGAASSAADDLGVAGTTTGFVITGTRLTSGLGDSLLSRLSGGAGLGELGSIQITDRDGGPEVVELSGAETIDDVVDLINASAAEVVASINSARNGIVVTDDSGGSGNLIIANNDATNSADKLGIAVNSAVASINSGTLRRQTISEATLLSSLNGGNGVLLGDIQITDSDGVVRTADLDSFGNKPETVRDVIDAINALTNGVEARINDTGDGLLLTDTADGDGTFGVRELGGDIASTLNLTRASKTIEIEGVDTQVIDGTRSYEIDLADIEGSSDEILLSSLNAGEGVAEGFFVITDTQNRSITIDLSGAESGVTTVGQLIDAINAKGAARQGGFSVTARINDAGTGIQLEDASQAGGAKIVVREGNSTAAADLRLLGESTTVGGKKVINGAGTFTAGAANASRLSALAARINELGAGVTASTVFDGEGHRLSLLVDQTGSANQLLVDAGDSTLQFEEVSKADDALLLFGNFNSNAAGLLLASSDNTFAGAVGGLDLTVSGASETPVTITVEQTDVSFVEAAEDFVESYNALRTDLGKLTAFDPNANTTGLLFGTNAALQVDSRLSRALTDRYFGLGSLQSLEQIGLSVNENGELELDKAKLQGAFEADPAGVENFFTKADTGVAAKIGAVIDGLAGEDESLLATRSDAIQAKIETNQLRIDRFNLQLEIQQERLLNQFFQLEQVIARLKQNEAALNNIQFIPPLGSRTQQ